MRLTKASSPASQASVWSPGGGGSGPLSPVSELASVVGVSLSLLASVGVLLSLAEPVPSSPSVAGASVVAGLSS